MPDWSAHPVPHELRRTPLLRREFQLDADTEPSLERPYATARLFEAYLRPAGLRRRPSSGLEQL